MLINNAKNIAKTVLVVDDSQDMVVLFKSLLKSRGYTVLTASNPDEAFRLFQLHTEIKLIIIDINLKAKENGISLAKKFHDFGESRQFSMCLASSSHVDESFIEAVHKIGVEEFIPKPVNLQSFGNKVDDMLGASLKNIDVSKRITCHFCCEIVDATIHPKMELVEITPNSFLINCSANATVGTVLDIRCTSLQAILNKKIFRVKVQETSLGISSDCAFQLRVQPVDPDYAMRLQLESLFERSKLPEGMSLMKDIGLDAP